MIKFIFSITIMIMMKNPSIYALDDYWLDKDYDYHPERDGEYPIVQDAHFNPEYVGFDTKVMSIAEILEKFEQ